MERLIAVVDPTTGTPTVAASKVVRIVHNHFKSKLAAPRQVKTGQYMPSQAPRDYPWERQGAKDRFRLTTDATLQQQRKWLLTHMQDEQAFLARSLTDLTHILKPIEAHGRGALNWFRRPHVLLTKIQFGKSRMHDDMIQKLTSRCADHSLTATVGSS